MCEIPAGSSFTPLNERLSVTRLRSCPNPSESEQVNCDCPKKNGDDVGTDAPIMHGEREEG